jgi:hypothetical protein
MPRSRIHGISPLHETPPEHLLSQLGVLMVFFSSFQANTWIVSWNRPLPIPPHLFLVHLNYPVILNYIISASKIIVK